MSKVLVVDYCAEAVFKLPKGLDDLNDKTRVEKYWIRYAILHIRLVDGSCIEIEPKYEPEPDFKDGHCNERIQDAYDWGFTDDEEDEEEEEVDEKEQNMIDTADTKQIAKKIVCDIIDKVKAEAEAKAEAANLTRSLN